MFIGYQNDLIAFVADTREELENLPCVELDKIEEVDFAEMFNGVIYTSVEELNQAKGEEVRAVRNQYLETYVDPVVSNPLRWADMSAEEQQQYSDYRQYLLHITEAPEFPDVAVLTMDEWLLTVPAKDSDSTVVELSETSEDVVELYSMEI